LAHKTGKGVWGLGWFRDAVASTRKRVATAPGHNWVVLAIAFCVRGRVILGVSGHEVLRAPAGRFV
jgi:hypothetical protein